MESKTVSVGVIGTSMYADLMHLASIKSHPQAKLEAICGRTRTRAEEMATKYEIPNVFTDYEEMIERAELDALIIAAPDDFHSPITIAALDAGLHVLCEKPLALTLEQAREMYHLANTAGVKHMTYFTYRWLPAYRFVRELIQDGYIGRCFSSQFRFVGGYGRAGQYGWRWDGQHSLGVLGDLGVHMIDLSRWFVGEIDSVSAHLPTFISRVGNDAPSFVPVNDAALLTLQFKDGSHGVIQVSAVAHVGDRGQEVQILLHGENGTLELDFDWKDGTVIRGAKRDDDQIMPISVPEHMLDGLDYGDHYFDQLNHIFTTHSTGSRFFIDAIVNDQPITPSFYDGLKAQEVLHAAIEADRSQSWVSI